MKKLAVIILVAVALIAGPVVYEAQIYCPCIFFWNDYDCNCLLTSHIFLNWCGYGWTLYCYYSTAGHWCSYPC